MAMNKVIITCAVTGSIHTPSMSPYLPVTPAEIADAAIGAAQAGAAIVHLHARNPRDGSPTQDPNVFREFLPKIKAASDVVINITTGGAPTMSVEKLLQPALQVKRTADRLFGHDYFWSVLGAGRNQIPIATMSAAMGGNVRVGLEDSLWDGPGKLAESNAAQVRRVRTVIEALSLEIATPDDARRMLALKGRDRVAF